MDMDLLKQTLMWIAFSGGAGVLAYFLWEQLERWFEDLKKIPGDIENYITMALTGIFATLAYLIMLWAGYAELPIAAIGWAEALFSVFGAAIGVTRLLHGAKKAKERKA